MIAKAIKGTGFRGTLEYVARGGPRIGGNMAGETPRELAAEFGHVRALRPNLSAAVLHLPIRPAPGESLSNDEWNAVAERMLTGLGYADVPYVVYRHGTADDEHIHIVASRVTYSGQVVSASNDYYRAMAALRAIERDLGLRIVPFREDAARRPGQAEHQLVQRTARPSRRTELQDLIREASAGRPSVTIFFDRLQQAGVAVVPNLARTGHITGLSYRYGDLLAKGSTLGRAYTWRGVLHHLGVDYDIGRDLPALLAARARNHASPRTGPADDVPARTTPTAPAAPETATVVDLTALQLRRHLRALGAARYDVLALDVRAGRQELRLDWTPGQIEHALGWLRHENARGAEILIRPRDASIGILADVPEATVRSARAQGFAPAAAVEVGAGTFEIWLRQGAEVSEQEAAVLRPLAARSLHLSPERSPVPWGHLAGFTSADDASADRPRYVRLREHQGAPYARAGDLLARARSHLEDVGLQRDVARELRQQDQLAREHGPADDPLRQRRLPQGVVFRPLAPSEVTREAARQGVEALRRAETAHGRAVEELAGCSPADFAARYETAIATHRDLALARHRLEDLADHRPLPQLPPADWERYVELRGRLLRSEERLLAGTELEKASGALSHRTAVRELQRFVASHSLRPEGADSLARRALAEPPGRLERVYRGAAGEVERIVSSLPVAPSGENVTALRNALGRRLAAELPLEGHRGDLQRALRGLASERESLLARVGEVQQLSPSAQQALWQRLERVEARMGVLDSAVARSSREAVARTAAQLEQGLIATPTSPRLRAYTEALGELRRWDRRLELSASGPGAPQRNPAITTLPPGRRQGPAADLEILRAEVGRTAAALLGRPEPQTFTAYREALSRHWAASDRHDTAFAWREYRGVRRELEGALREASRGRLPVEAGSASRWRALFDRHEAAQQLALDHWAAPPPPSVRPEAAGQRLQALAARLRHDDTPSFAAALRREAAARLTRTHGFTPPPPPPPPLPSTLAEAALEFRRARADLLRASRAVAREVSPATIERLQHALVRHQARADQLRTMTVLQPATPGPRLLRPEHFLAHPRFAGAPDRAAAAWAAYAARQGVPEHAIAAALGRVPRSQRALPGVGSLQDASFVAGLAVLWATRIARRLVRERVHTP